jgi:hypothetical protein
VWADESKDDDFENSETFLVSESDSKISSFNFELLSATQRAKLYNSWLSTLSHFLFLS